MMFTDDGSVDTEIFGKSLAERFKNLKTQKKVKEFFAKRRSYNVLTSIA